MPTGREPGGRRILSFTTELAEEVSTTALVPACPGLAGWIRFWDLGGLAGPALGGSTTATPVRDQSHDQGHPEGCEYKDEVKIRRDE